VLVAMWWLKALVMIPASSSRVSFSRPVMRMMPLGRLYMMLKSLCMPWEWSWLSEGVLKWSGLCLARGKASLMRSLNWSGLFVMPVGMLWLAAQAFSSSLSAFLFFLVLTFFMYPSLSFFFWGGRPREPRASRGFC